jgi:hypothetical protein
MNQKDQQIQRNNVRRLFRHQSGIHTNCIRLNPANTYDHERLKFETCWNLLKEGKEFITEAEFENPFKKRCDIVCLDSGVIYEIVVSEKEESLIKKSKEYPLPIIIIKPKMEED